MRRRQKMKIKFLRPTVYMSHPIRGSNGDVEGNCKKAEAAARRLRRVFSEVNFYVPAEHDLTLQLLTSDDRLYVEDIMWADTQILRACHGWMFYSFDDSIGSEIEWHEAEKLGLTPRNTTDQWFIYDIEKASNEKLRRDFGPLIKETVRRFKERER